MKQLQCIPQRTRSPHPIYVERCRTETALKDKQFWQYISGTLLIVVIVTVILLIYLFY